MSDKNRSNEINPNESKTNGRPFYSIVNQLTPVGCLVLIRIGDGKEKEVVLGLSSKQAIEMAKNIKTSAEELEKEQELEKTLPLLVG